MRQMVAADMPVIFTTSSRDKTLISKAHSALRKKKPQISQGERASAAIGGDLI
jgi:hypothetical protein